MSGDRATFLGDQLAAVVQAIAQVADSLGQPPVVVGGLAVLARLSTPHRATVDLDVVDRMLGPIPHLEVLRAVEGATAEEPAAVLLPTPLGMVKVDVLQVRQVELDHPSDDPGDRLHASAHAWAYDTATPMTLEVIGTATADVAVTTPVAEPGPLIAMKLQAVMNRAADKQGTDLLDIVRITLDPKTRTVALSQIAAVDEAIARDMAVHVDFWLRRHQARSLQWITKAGAEVTTDDLDLVAELLEHTLTRH
ncbi:hypothetical protein [Kineosporia sp. R_H_3]|uniref:hypothetical protein n=1 Tax=Kineosporia sp. R_H_3 TaxID=1961848 RepID=UPI0018E991F4|nr:hypothetical protein [Kineosporia sp. R_H_3]